MKHILITVVAAVLVGCGESQQSTPTPEAKTVKPATEATDYSGTYTLSLPGNRGGGAQLSFELNSDGSFIGKSSTKQDDLNGSWKVDDDLLVCEAQTQRPTEKVVIKFNKITGRLNAIWEIREMPIEEQIPEGEDGLYVKKN